MPTSRIVNGHPWSIGCGDQDPQKRGEDVALMSDLPEDVQRKVSNWIFGKLWKIQSPNYNHNSYELKHLLEKDITDRRSNMQLFV